MLTTIAALYVVLPAVLALVAVAVAMYCPVAIVCEEEGIVMQGANTDAGRIVYTQARDMYARKAVFALTQLQHWSTQRHEAMCAFWRVEAEECRAKAEVMNRKAYGMPVCA